MGHVVENVFTAAASRETVIQKPESDTEEFYSMFMENLVFELEFLHAMSSHYQTGSKIPKAVSAPRLTRGEFFDVLNTARWWEVSMKEREIHRGPPNQDLMTRLARVEHAIYGNHRFL